MSWLKTILWVLMTGGMKSPLRVLQEGEHYVVVRRGGRLHVERPADPVKEPEATPMRFDRGRRVVALDTAGFHRGARGSVSFQEPGPGGRVWVLRDGAGSEVFYYPHELAADTEAEE